MTNTKIGIALITFNLISLPAFANELSDEPFFKEHKIWAGVDHSRDHKSTLIGIDTTLNKDIWGMNPNFSIEYLQAKYDGIPRPGYSEKNSYLSFTPTLKKQFNNGIYLKAGVGVAYQEHKKWQHHKTGGNFQFHPTASIGYEWKNISFEVQYSHFSNADTNKPNPGEDFTIFKIGYKF